MAIARHWVDAKQDDETQLRYFNGILVQNTRTTLKNYESVIAEGVENAETLALLEGMGCEQAQGYHLSRALPLDRLIDWLRTH